MKPFRSNHQSSDSTLSLVPFGSGGLDLFTHESLLGLQFLRQADNVRNPKGSLERRKGDKKIAAFTDRSASKTFGADTKYATIPAASQLQTLAAGFAFIFGITAVRPGAGDTGYILSSRINGQSYHVLRATIDENGLLTVGFEKASGGDCAVTTTALSSGAAARCLAIFDSVAGTFSLYVNGIANGTPVTGLTVADGPIAGALTDWHIGAHYDPATTAIVSDTHFDGKCQGFTLLSLRGMRAASGTTTMASALARHTAHVWPAPQAPNVLFNYDFFHTSTTTLYDQSRFKNHATLTGTPSNTTSLIPASVIPANFVGYLEGPDGRADNVVGSTGATFYETILTGE